MQPNRYTVPPRWMSLDVLLNSWGVSTVPSSAQLPRYDPFRSRVVGVCAGEHGNAANAMYHTYYTNGAAAETGEDGAEQDVGAAGEEYAHPTWTYTMNVEDVCDGAECAIGMQYMLELRCNLAVRDARDVVSFEARVFPRDRSTEPWSVETMRFTSPLLVVAAGALTWQDTQVTSVLRGMAAEWIGKPITVKMRPVLRRRAAVQIGRLCSIVRMVPVGKPPRMQTREMAERALVRVPLLSSTSQLQRIIDRNADGTEVMFQSMVHTLPPGARLTGAGAGTYARAWRDTLEQEVWMTNASSSICVSFSCTNGVNAQLPWFVYGVHVLGSDGQVLSRVYVKEREQSVIRGTASGCALDYTVELPAGAHRVVADVTYAASKKIGDVQFTVSMTMLQAALLSIEHAGSVDVHALPRFAASRGVHGGDVAGVPRQPRVLNKLVHLSHLLQKVVPLPAPQDASGGTAAAASGRAARRVCNVVGTRGALYYVATAVVLTPLYHSTIPLAAVVQDFSYEGMHTAMDDVSSPCGRNVMLPWVLSPLYYILGTRAHGRGASGAPHPLAAHYFTLGLLLLAALVVAACAQYLRMVHRVERTVFVFPAHDHASYGSEEHAAHLISYADVGYELGSGHATMDDGAGCLSPHASASDSSDHATRWFMSLRAQHALLSVVSAVLLYTYTCVTYTAYRALVRCHDAGPIVPGWWGVSAPCGYGVLIPCIGVLVVSFGLLVAGPMLVVRGTDTATRTPPNTFPTSAVGCSGGRGWPLPLLLPVWFGVTDVWSGGWVWRDGDGTVWDAVRACRATRHRVPLARRVLRLLCHQCGEWRPPCSTRGGERVPNRMLGAWALCVWWCVDHRRVWRARGTLVVAGYLHAFCFLMSLGCDGTFRRGGACGARRVGCGATAGALTLLLACWYARCVPLRHTVLNWTRAVVYALLAVQVLVATFRPRHVAIVAPPSVATGARASVQHAVALSGVVGSGSDGIGVAVMALGLLDGLLHVLCLMNS